MQDIYTQPSRGKSMIPSEVKEEAVSQAVKAIPAVTAAASTMVLGLTINEVLAVCSIAFIGLQAAYLIWKWMREAKREAVKSGEEA